MGKFSFKLQPVLKHREILEDQARQGFATALQREQALQEQIAHRRAELAELQADLQRRQLHGIAVQDLLLFEESIAHRGRILSGLGKDLDLAGREVAERREELASASRDRRLLEKLKERKQDEYRRETARLETIMLDEIALQMEREGT